MPVEENNIPIGKKRRKKKKRNLSYIYLFAIVFLCTLGFLSYIVKSYSPDVDVEIGNNETLTLSDSEMDVEIKSVDERLKWIQDEDEMPTVAIRTLPEEPKSTKSQQEKNDKINETTSIQEPIIKTPPKPKMDEIIPIKKDFREKENTSIIPKPLPSMTKVYLGSYSSIEEAMKIQEKVSSDESSLIPFVKTVKDKYIVQLGSFSDKEKADALVSKLKSKGYNPKIIYEN